MRSRIVTISIFASILVTATGSISAQDTAKPEFSFVFIAGEKDPVIGGANADQLTELLNGGTKDLRGVKLFPATGHWVQQERVKQTNTAILEFVNGVSPALSDDQIDRLRKKFPLLARLTPANDKLPPNCRVKQIPSEIPADEIEELKQLENLAITVESKHFLIADERLKDLIDIDTIKATYFGLYRKKTIAALSAGHLQTRIMQGRHIRLWLRVTVNKSTVLDCGRSTNMLYGSGGTPA